MISPSHHHHFEVRKNYRHTLKIYVPNVLNKKIISHKLREFTTLQWLVVTGYWFNTTEWFDGDDSWRKSYDAVSIAEQRVRFSRRLKAVSLERHTETSGWPALNKVTSSKQSCNLNCLWNQKQNLFVFKILNINWLYHCFGRQPKTRWQWTLQPRLDGSVTSKLPISKLPTCKTGPELSAERSNFSLGEY